MKILTKFQLNSFIGFATVCVVFFLGGKFTAKNVYSASCPWSCSGGTIQCTYPSFISGFAAPRRAGDGSGSTSWGSTTQLERGQPFEAGVVSNYDNVARCGGPCAFYAGNCGMYSIGCGSMTRFYMRGYGNGWDDRRRHDLYGRMIVGNSTLSNWANYYRYPGAVSWFVSAYGNAANGKNTFIKWLGRWGYAYEFYTDGNIVRDGGQTPYSNPADQSCGVGRKTVQVVDNNPVTRFGNLEYCKGVNEIVIPIRLRDQQGVDDIGNVYLSFYRNPGGYTGMIQIRNNTAQRYNNWMWDQVPNYRLYTTLSPFNTYLSTSTITGPNNRNRSGRLNVTVRERPTLNLEDLSSFRVYADDAQFSAAEDFPRGPVRSAEATGNITWLDKPTGTASFNPRTIEYPGSSTVTWNLADAASCTFSISSPEGACTPESNVPVPCSGSRVVTPVQIGGSIGNCYASIEGQNACGSTRIQPIFTVRYAEPWLMTTYGDTYAYQGYDSMKIWRVSNPEVPARAKNGQNAYFSFYLVSRRSGTWPNPSSLRSYLLQNYNDDNRAIIGSSKLYEYFSELIDPNSPGCNGIQVRSSIPGSCNDQKSIFLINGNVTLPSGWNVSPTSNRTCVVIASGNITIPANVDRVDAFLLADGSVITGADPQQLRINGGAVANRINFRRDLPQNSDNPAEIITYDAKYFSALRDCLGEEYPFRIREFRYSSATESEN